MNESKKAELGAAAERAREQARERAGDPRAWLGLARALMRVGDTAGAGEALEKAAALAGSPDAELALALAEELHRAGRLEGAISWYQTAGRLAPADPEPHHRRGVALREAGDPGAAAGAQREALARAPGHEPALAHLGAALAELGDYAGALEAFERLAEGRSGTIGTGAPSAALGGTGAPSAALGGVAVQRRGELAGQAAEAAQRRLLGKDLAAVASAGIVHGAGFQLAGEAAGLRAWRAPWGELEARHAGGRVRELRLFFHDAQASAARLDLSYGGAETDAAGRRVPLDELTAAALVFLSHALGIDHEPARALYRHLLKAEGRRLRVNGCEAGWIERSAADGRREVGLFAALPGPVAA